MSAIIDRWSDKDIINIVTYARTLPKDSEQAKAFGGNMMGDGMGHHQPGTDSRGFGPITK